MDSRLRALIHQLHEATETGDVKSVSVAKEDTVGGWTAVPWGENCTYEQPVIDTTYKIEITFTPKPRHRDDSGD